MKEERNIKLSLDKAKEIYPDASNEVKVLLESTFPELIEVKYPKTHKELQQILVNNDTIVYYLSDRNSVEQYSPTGISDYNKNIFLCKERIEEHLAFIQLITLMDYYNQVDEFKPNWCDINQEKYIITCYKNEIVCGSVFAENHTLAFKSSNTRDLFLYNFKELIEQCKNLI